MNELQSRKRNVAFILWLALAAIFLVLLLPLLPPVLRPSKRVYMSLVLPAAFAVPAIFWFKGLYYWAKGKGYAGGLALLGILGFPVVVLVIALLKDRSAAVAPVDSR